MLSTREGETSTVLHHNDTVRNIRECFVVNFFLEWKNFQGRSEEPEWFLCSSNAEKTIVYRLFSFEKKKKKESVCYCRTE